MPLFELQDGLGDWRIAAASRLAQDVPAAFSGGPAHKAGAPVYLTELVTTPSGPVGFLTPSATAMAFSIAVNASRHAKRLSENLTYDRVLTPDGPGRSVSNARTGDLYDFFEQCMVAVTFSFQALEVYANHSISRELRDPMEVKRAKAKVYLTPSEVERQLSTDEKLSTVLPRIRKLPTPKGKAVWDKFKLLKDTRDATIHLKSRDMRSSDRSGKDHLFFQFLTVDPHRFPQAAEEMIRYFEVDRRPRWLSALSTK